MATYLRGGGRRGRVSLRSAAYRATVRFQFNILRMEIISDHFYLYQSFTTSLFRHLQFGRFDREDAIGNWYTVAFLNPRLRVCL